MSITGLLILVLWIVIVCVVVYAACLLIDFVAGAVGMPPALSKILKIVVGLFALILVITWLVGALPAPPHLAIE